MNDAERPAAAEPKGKAAKAGPSRSPGMLQDPVVRWMAWIAITIVILFLATVLGALLTGVQRPEAPSTVAERELLVAASQVQAGAVGAAWAPYIDALIATGDLQKARITLDTARASVQSTETVPELELSEARLELAQKRFAQAEQASGRSLKAFKDRQAAAIAAGGEKAKTAEQAGPGSEYYDAALVRAYALLGLERWKDAVAMFDLYISQNPTASDILVDRGNAKASMKDKAGAEKDFKEALRFVPYDKEAQAGLKRIGAAK